MSMTSEDVRHRVLGDRTKGEVVREAEVFSKSSTLLLSADIAREYPGQWVAAYDGKIIAASSDPDALFNRVAVADIPQNLIAIRYIEREGVVTY